MQASKEQSPKEEPELSSQQLFDNETKFVPALANEETDVEQEITHILAVKKKRWGLRALAISGVGLTLWQSVNNLADATLNQDWLALGWSGFVAGIAAVGISAVTREFLALQQLKGRQDTRVKLENIAKAGGIGKAKSECEKLAKQSQIEMTPAYDKWQNALAATHNDREVFELYDGLVLKGQDKRAIQIVSKNAAEAGVMVALSPLAVADMALVAWRNIRLIDQIANLYGVSLGYWSRISLLRLVLVNMAMAGSAEVISDTSMELLSVGVTGKLSSRAAQGLGVGLLTARLGYKAIALMRPLPHLSSEAPKLSSIRKELLGKLSS